MKEIEIFNDHFQNFKRQGIPHAQLIIADPPYNLGNSAYASNPSWYVGGDNKNGESELAGKEFFDTDKDFRPAEFMHFCSQMLVREPKQGMTDEEYEQAEKIGSGKKVKSKAPCMLLFCGFEQMTYYIDLGKRYGFAHYIPLVFRKNYSAQVLKANMKVVGNCEYGLILYRDKLPKFNNHGRMIFNCMDYPRDGKTPKVHPTQKSVPLLEFLIETFTDEGDVVIDPCCGSGTTLLAAGNLGRRAYGFEIKKEFVKAAKEKILPLIQKRITIEVPKERKYTQMDMFSN
jgi:site-specific DNA-methyltransferase (adenine-specific)